MSNPIMVPSNTPAVPADANAPEAVATVIPTAVAVPFLDPQIQQDATDAAGVILTSKTARGVVAIVMGTYAAGLSVTTTGLAALIGAGYGQHIPHWVGPALIVAASVYIPVSSITHGIWKANIK